MAPEDRASPYAIELAETMLQGFATGMGAYTESKGPRFIREAVADVQMQRSLPDTIKLTVTSRTPLAAVEAGKGFYVLQVMPKPATPR